MVNDAIRVLDLFSGIGGFSLGLEWTGRFQTVGFCEIDKKARAILERRWPGVPIFDDVRSVNAASIRDRCGQVDVVCGGFPCQDISLAGNGAGLDGSRSGLWFEMHRIISEIRPRWVIAENVAALRSRGLDRVLGSLAEIGYDAEWNCIPASAVGAPHRRDRVWIVAYPVCGTRRRGTGHAREGEAEQGREPGRGSGAADVADAEGHAWRSGLREARSVGDRDLPRDGGPALPDSDRPGCVEQRRAEPVLSQLATAECRGWWSVEPDVGRVAHGVPRRVDRLKQLGNAVVPHIPYLIGQAIAAAEDGRC